MNTDNRFCRASATLSILTFFLTGLLYSADPNDKASVRTLQFSKFPANFDYRTPLTPESSLLLRFNAEVEADKAGSHFTFFNEAGKEKDLVKIPVKSHRPSLNEIRSYGKYLVPKNLAENKQASFSNRFVVIKPVTELPIGYSWRLQYLKGLTNFAETHRLKEDGSTPVGHLKKFVIEEVRTHNPYDQAMTIFISFNKYRLRESFNADALADYIDISPKPDGFRIEPEDFGVRLHGKFEYDKGYDVEIDPGLIGNDNTSLSKGVKDTMLFSPNRGFLRIPLMSETQNASGHRSFEIETANLQAIRTRVKSLKGDNLIFALKGYQDGYKGNGGDQTIPFSMIPGKTVYDDSQDTTAKWDITEKFSFNWSDINGSSQHGAYYVSVGGSKEDNGPGFETHSLVQLTDIGLTWKQNQTDTMLYAFSIKDGSARAGMPIRLLTDEGEEVAVTKTDNEGIARFAATDYKDADLWLDAKSGDDRHVMAFSSHLDRIGLWSFNIPYRYSGVKEGERRTLIFTDRDVYKPGETVYLKCLSRTIDSDSLLPVAACRAQFTVKDPRGRKLVDKTVKFSANGSFHDEIKIPEIGMGQHSVEINFNDPDNEEDSDWDKISRHQFNVAEYRVNTFEVSMEAKDVKNKDIVSIPLSAKYYMGKPLSKAKVNWTAYSNNQYPNPKGFSEFNFGDRWQDSNGDSRNESIRLSSSGKAEIEIAVPIDSKSPAPRHVSVRAEVTDVNQQTISEHTGFTVHSSDFYIGIRKPEGIHRAGDTVPFVIANIDTDGEAYQSPVKTSITVEKEFWTTVKVKGSDGKITHRNHKHHELTHQETVAISTRNDEASSLALSQNHNIKFEEAGDYRITLEATDADGRKVLTRERFEVIGAEEPSWAWNDVVAIDVIPDRKLYKVGDTANLLVRSPVFGRALVTTERGDVKSTQSIDIAQHETVIKIPIEPGAAPNIFASVLIIRGSDQSPHKHPTADYRLGYCQLDIDDPGADLEVTLDAGPDKYYIPGQPVEVSALVTDNEGSGISGAEVTLYAVDEGILSLTGYQTPDPGEVFHKAFPLSVMMGQSLSDLLPENPRERDFGNKGFVVGGGGMAGDQAGGLGKLRKDFKAVAFWAPELTTDKNGKVSYTFNAPDNLTSFRLIAVVAKKNRFGSSDAAVVINKPIIIEPAIPSFSNLSDQIDLTAVLHNNTDQPQRLAVDVNLDEHAMFIDRLGTIMPTGLSNTPQDDRHKFRELSISPGQTEVLHFPVAMVKTGEAKWQWKARSLTDSKLVDVTESTLPVRFPLPLLKSSKSITLKDSEDRGNILSDVNPRLLDGIGDIEITISNSRMIEATDAIDYLLGYPYGCVEQTTSKTIPWMSTNQMRKVMPSLDVSEAEINKAIKKGTTRLLSMQTRSGGLSYWPGDNQPVLWGSAYGGLALAIASKNDVDLPQDRLDDLWRYLSGNLRDSAKLTEAYDLSQRCLSLYTLAVAGKPEPAYLDVLYNKRTKLPIEARALLALAIMESNVDPSIPDKRVETLLTEPAGDARSNVGWYRQPYLKSTQLMAWARFRPNSEKTDQLLSELMALRRPGRDWGSTYSNAWPLMALASHSNASTSSLSNHIVLQFGERTEEISFVGTLASRSFTFPFEGDVTGQLMQLKVSNPGQVHANIKVATQPKLLPAAPENRGFAITRTYQKLDIEGNLHPAENLMVGDLVLVQLDVDMPQAKEKYIAIDDPLPSILESVNSSFKTQATRGVKRTEKTTEEPAICYLHTNHRELRKDRTLFFADSVYRDGKHRVQYLTRVIAPGDSIAPAAKIESMYEPDRYGLSDTQIISARTLDLGDDKVAQR